MSGSRGERPALTGCWHWIGQWVSALACKLSRPLVWNRIITSHWSSHGAVGSGKVHMHHSADSWFQCRPRRYSVHGHFARPFHVCDDVELHNAVRRTVSAIYAWLWLAEFAKMSSQKFQSLCHQGKANRYNHRVTFGSAFRSAFSHVQLAERLTDNGKVIDWCELFFNSWITQLCRLFVRAALFMRHR